MKIKLSNVLRGKERKKQRNKCRKNNIMFKKLKIRIIKKRKEKNRRRKKQENSTGLQKPNIEGEDYKNSKKCD